MINEAISQLVQDALQELGLSGEVVLEHPSDVSHGDFSCNIAMVLAKQVGNNPRELAEEIVAQVQAHEYVKEVTVAGPGFINFSLSEEFFSTATKVIVEAGKDWGHGSERAGETILFEHSSPNLFKPFHIGHLVNNTLGESLVRIVGATGAIVIPLSYPSDVSPGIAKAVWGIIDKGWSGDITIERIGEAYAHGVAEYDSNDEVKNRIDVINKALYNKEEGTPEWNVYASGKEISLEYFQYITKKLGSQFAEFIFESDAEVRGKAIVKENTPGVFEESDGAIIFRGSNYGLFDNVFINSAGFGTYLAKDIGLLSLKFEKHDFTESITITDIEQKQHFELVKKAAELITDEWAKKSTYVQHGRLELTSGKISSRLGNVPLADDIIETVQERALARMEENERTLDTIVARHIAIAAIKYAIARVGMGKNIVFDMEQALSLEGDTGPYLQYTYARARSILQKAVDEGSNSESTARGESPIVDVERLLYRFPSVVARAAREFEPHYVANYLASVASAYNSWYAREQVLDGSETQQYKLAVTSAVAITMQNGLELLGIETPEKM